MATRDRLQIVLITYNRELYLQKTFDQIFCAGSPIKDFDITILDNHSTDNTEACVKEVQTNNPNLKYIKNRFNVGGNANIAKALEMANRDYLWVLCDDDKYDWSGWSEVENLISRNEKLISVANFNLNLKHRADIAYQINQFTFLPSIILHTSLLTDTVIRNAYDSGVFLFPHLSPVITHVNNGGTINVIAHALVTPGHYKNDVSYIRGSNANSTFFRARSMMFPVAYANLCRNLTDTRLARRCLEVRLAGEHTERLGYRALCREVFLHLNGRRNSCHIVDLTYLMPIAKRVLVTFVHLLSCTPLQPLLTNSPFYTFLRKRLDAKNRAISSNSSDK